MRIESDFKPVFEVKVQLILYLHTFMITILAQVHQSSKISHARMISFHDLCRCQASICREECNLSRVNATYRQTLATRQSVARLLRHMLA